MTVFVFSLISSGNIMVVQAQSTCSYGDDTLPCIFGGCTFSKDAHGTLSKTGSCTGTTGSLYLKRRGITALSAGVFYDVGAA
jgi:hypothetical protein